MQSMKDKMVSGTAVGIGALMIAQSAFGHQPEGIIIEDPPHTHQEKYDPPQFSWKIKTTLSSSADFITTTTAPPDVND